MDRTPIYDRLISAGAHMSEYCGVETARSFGDVRAEYDTLLTAAGVYDLGWRAKIVLTGGDRMRWANGMVTNNVRDLPEGSGNYSFMLNAQGRIQADLYIYNMGDHLLVDTEWWQKSKILELFDKFIIMDDVEVADISDKLTAVAVQGPKALETLRKLGLTIADEVEPLKVAQMTWNGIGISVTRMASKIAQTFEIWLAGENAQSFGMRCSKQEPSPGNRSARDVPCSGRRAAVWRRHFRQVRSAGDGAVPCAALLEGMLSRTGNRRTSEIAWGSASAFRRVQN